MPLTDVDQETLSQLWAETFSELKDIRNVEVEFRTLYDYEELDALKRATSNEDPTIQQFTLVRWQLAYGIKSVGGSVFDGTPEAKYYEILRWPSIIVRLCADAMADVYQHEARLTENLKNFGSLAENTDSVSELTGLSPDIQDSEIGPEEQVDLENSSLS